MFRSVLSMIMDNGVVDTVEFVVPTIYNSHIRLNAHFVVTYMEQMERICLNVFALNVKEAAQEFATGVMQSIECFMRLFTVLVFITMY